MNHDQCTHSPDHKVCEMCEQMSLKQVENQFMESPDGKSKITLNVNNAGEKEIENNSSFHDTCNDIKACETCSVFSAEERDLLRLWPRNIAFPYSIFEKNKEFIPFFIDVIKQSHKNGWEKHRQYTNEIITAKAKISYDDGKKFMLYSLESFIENERELLE
ncbi:MAG: hypothetical protein V4549_03635 [Bacteroidota bacterium]